MACLPREWDLRADIEQLHVAQLCEQSPRGCESSQGQLLCRPDPPQRSLFFVGFPITGLLHRNILGEQDSV